MGVVLEFQKKKERKKNTEIEKQIGESDIQVGLSTFTVVVDGNGDNPPCLIGVIWIFFHLSVMANESVYVGIP